MLAGIKYMNFSCIENIAPAVKFTEFILKEYERGPENGGLTPLGVFHWMSLFFEAEYWDVENAGICALDGDFIERSREFREKNCEELIKQYKNK